MLSQAELDARLARYAVTRDGRDLWPEVPAGAFRAAQEAVARVAAAALGRGPEQAVLQCPPGVDGRALGVAASAAGMGPLLGFWVGAGNVAADAPVADLLAIHLDHGRRRAARLRAELDRIVAACASRSIEVLVLKGMHTAWSYFPDPGTRPVADIDVAVRPEDCAAAGGVLRALGFAEVAASAVAERSHWTRDGVGRVHSLEMSHADDPWHVDLHVSLDRGAGPGSTMSLGPLDPATWRPWSASSGPARVLPEPLLLAHLALHASSHLYALSLIRLVELILVARTDFAAHPERWNDFSDLVRRHAAGRFVFPGLDLAERLAPGTVDRDVLAACRAAAPRQLRRLVDAATPGSAQRLHPMPRGERYAWAASPRELLALLLDTAWPREAGKRVAPWEAARAHGRRIRWLLVSVLRRGAR